MHKALVGGGLVSAADFWSLPPRQVWWIIEDNLPEKPEAKASDSELLELRRMVKKAKEAEANE